MGLGLAAVQFASLQGAIREVRTSQSSLQQAQARLDAMPTEDAIRELRDRVLDVADVDPKGLDRTALHVWLSAALRDAGLRSQSITTLESTEAQGVTVHPIAVECTGHFSGVVAFLYSLDVSRLPIRVNRLHLAHVPDGLGELAIRMDLSTTNMGNVQW